MIKTLLSLTTETRLVWILLGPSLNTLATVQSIVAKGAHDWVICNVLTDDALYVGGKAQLFNLAPVGHSVVVYFLQ